MCIQWFKKIFGGKDGGKDDCCKPEDTSAQPTEQSAPKQSNNTGGEQPQQ